MSPTLSDKAALRERMIALRRQFKGNVRKEADTQIANRVLVRREVQRAQVLCIYQSYPSEVDTKEIIAALRNQGKTVVPPEPAPRGVDVFIVPGVAFDRHGYRLGRGGGYYDRVLAGVTVLKIGLAYACQMVSGLPHDRYDIPMNVVITEKKIYEAKTS